MSKHEKHALKRWNEVKPKKRSSMPYWLVSLIPVLFVLISRLKPMWILKACPWDLLETIMPVTMFIYHL